MNNFATVSVRELHAPAIVVLPRFGGRRDPIVDVARRTAVVAQLVNCSSSGYINDWKFSAESESIW